MTWQDGKITTVLVVVCIKGEPMGKPRMTRSDKWRTRACVQRYRDWCDRARMTTFRVNAKQEHAPLRLDWTAYLGMPKSWSKRKRDERRGKPHQQKPDRDNIDKGLLDALFADDSTCAFGELRKFWDDGQGPRLVVTIPGGLPLGSQHLLTARRGAR